MKQFLKLIAHHLVGDDESGLAFKCSAHGEHAEVIELVHEIAEIYNVDQLEYLKVSALALGEALLVIFKSLLAKIKSSPLAKILKNQYLCTLHVFKQYIL